MKQSPQAETDLNRIVATLTLLIGLAMMMVGVYATQWDTIQNLIRTFIPFIG